MMGWLNQRLPSRFIATVHTHLGWQVEADVAEWEKQGPATDDLGNGAAGGVAVQTWAPPKTHLTIKAVFPDHLEVEIRDQRRSYRLVAVVEMVSPSNKGDPASRRAFAAKSAAYLQRGVGLVVVDAVTCDHFNLHNELMSLMESAGSLRMPEEAHIYAVAYRPVHRGEENQIDVWPMELKVGEELPTLPLALLGRPAIPLELEATYSQARVRSRL
jgi:hypothetical protein